MALYRCGMGGAKIKQGTLTATGTSTEYTIDTGLSDINEFWLHGYSAGSSGYAMQHWFYYNKTDSGYVQYTYYGGGNSGANRTTIPFANSTRNFGFTSVTDGVVKIKTPNNSSWTNITFNWTAI